MAAKRIPASPVTFYFVALAIAIGLSGGAALIHEALWTRRLVDLLGATGESISRVLGAFFLGLSLGSAFASYVAKRAKNPLLVAGFAELAIALLCIPMLTLPMWSDFLWSRLGLEALLSWQGTILKTALSFGLVAPPAMGMGIVLPLVVSDWLRRHETQNGMGVVLYAVNTAGGMIGLVFVGLILVPTMGAWWSGVLAAVANLGVGLFLVSMSRSQSSLRRGSSSKFKSQSAETTTEPGGTSWAVVLLSFLSGACVLAVEVFAVRVIMLVAPISFYAPAVILGCVIGGLAIAPWIGHLLFKSSSHKRAVFQLLPFTAVALVIAPWLFIKLASVWNMGPAASLTIFLAKLVLLILLSFGPAFLLLGILFPLLLEKCGDERKSPGVWGRMFVANGIGGWFGAEFASAFLLPTVGIYWGIAVVSLALIVASFLLAGYWRSEAKATMRTVLFGSISVVAIAVGMLNTLPLVNPKMGLEVVDQRVDRNGTFAVVEHEGFGRALLVSNQYLLGSTSASASQRRQGHIPLMLHPAPKSVAFIGIATGITPGAALDHERVERLVAIELAPSVVSLAKEHFHKENHDLLVDQRTELIIDDARTAIAATEKEFDVVIGDLILPWSPGEGRLDTREHFSAVKRSLKEQGVYCQWLPAYQLMPDQLETIVHTFTMVFPNAELVRRELDSGSPVVGLIGWGNDQRIDWEVVRARCDEVRQHDLIKDPSLRSVEGVAMLALGSAKVFSNKGRVNTLNHPIVEFEAGLERVTGKPGAKYLIGARWLDYLRRKHVDLRGMPEELQDDAVDGLQWSIVEYVESRESEKKRGRQDVVLPKLPASLLEDESADWSQWPGNAAFVKRVREAR